MCQFSKFCCGCSLRAGAITAAVLNLVNVILILIGAAVLIYFGIRNDKEGYPSLARRDYSKAGLYLIAGCLGIVSFVCLIIAIKKSRPGLLMPWLVCFLLKIIIVGVCVTLAITVRYYTYFVMIAPLGFCVSENPDTGSNQNLIKSSTRPDILIQKLNCALPSAHNNQTMRNSAFNYLSDFDNRISEIEEIHRIRVYV
uniref:DUF7027 domain-containing protein n=1 Tax=Strigamia maritima TaxID=126957 RepID=T1J832_STRMM